MLSYRHQFHAGGAADVLKHAVLCQLVLALRRKEKPFHLLDTHGGLGLYDLAHAWSEKTGEWRDGVGRIWERDDAPDALKPYLDAVRAENPDGRLRRYPGSPRIARRLMRPTDRLTVAELNKDDFAVLAQGFKGVLKTELLNSDGFQAIGAKLPPIERRGLTFIDASYDQADEFQRILDAVQAADRRFRTGMLAVWRPLLKKSMQAFDEGFRALGLPKTLKLGVAIHAETRGGHARGSDLVIVNPPYRLDEEAPAMLDWLWRALSPAGAGGPIAEWLIPE